MTPRRRSRVSQSLGTQRLWRPRRPRVSQPRGPRGVTAGRDARAVAGRISARDVVEDRDERGRACGWQRRRGGTQGSPPRGTRARGRGVIGARCWGSHPRGRGESPRRGWALTRCGRLRSTRVHPCYRVAENQRRTPIQGPPFELDRPVPKVPLKVRPSGVKVRLNPPDCCASVHRPVSRLPLN